MSAQVQQQQPIANKDAFFSSTALLTRPEKLPRADGSTVEVLVGELSVEAATTLQCVSLALLYLDEKQMYDAAITAWESRYPVGPEVVPVQYSAPVVDDEDAVMVLGQTESTVGDGGQVESDQPKHPEKPALSERVWQLAEIYWRECESVDSAVVVLGVMLIVRNADGSPMFANVADTNDIKRMRANCSDLSLKAFYDRNVRAKQAARQMVQEQEKN